MLFKATTGLRRIPWKPTISISLEKFPSARRAMCALHPLEIVDLHTLEKRPQCKGVLGLLSRGDHVTVIHVFCECVPQARLCKTHYP